MVVDDGFVVHENHDDGQLYVVHKQIHWSPMTFVNELDEQNWNVSLREVLVFVDLVHVEQLKRNRNQVISL